MRLQTNFKEHRYCYLFELTVVTFSWNNFRILPSWYRLCEYGNRGRGWDINWLGFEFVFEQLVSRGMGACTLKEWKESQK